MHPKRIFARDRRGAAIHEAGHVVVARWAGLEVASAWIAPNVEAADDENTWCGRIQVVSVSGVPASIRRMVGVAGSVAEHLWFGGWIEDYYPDGMSESDRYLAGCSPSDESYDPIVEAAEEVARLIDRGRPERQTLMAEARRMIVESR